MAVSQKCIWESIANHRGSCMSGPLLCQSLFVLDCLVSRLRLKTLRLLLIKYQTQRLADSEVSCSSCFRQVQKIE